MTQSAMVSATVSKWVVNNAASVVHQLGVLQHNMDLANSKGISDFLTWIWPDSNFGMHFYSKEPPAMTLRDGEIGVEAALGAKLKNFGDDCKTKSNKPCVFPFRYKGKLHESCTGEGHVRWWCATKVDSDVNFDSSALSEEWDFCSDTCEKTYLDMDTKLSATISANITAISPQTVEIWAKHASFGVFSTDARGACETILGDKCLFPFDYEGKTYHECTDAGTSGHAHRLWCNTCESKHWFSHYSGNCWGTCSASCPGLQKLLLEKISKKLEDGDDLDNSFVLDELTHGTPVKLENASLDINQGAMTFWTNFHFNVTPLLETFYGHDKASTYSSSTR